MLGERLLSEYLGRKRPQLCSPAPCSGGESGLAADLIEICLPGPTRLLGDLGEKEPLSPLEFHDESMATDLD